MGGLSGSISVSAGERVGTNKRLIDAAVNYVGGPLHLGFGYSDHDQQSQWGVRALVELGAVTLGGYVQRDDVGPATRTVFRLAGMYAFGANELHLNFGRSGEAKAGGTVYVPKGDQWTLGYNYNISKRTKIYGYYTDLDSNKSARNAGEYSSLAMGVRHNF
jgi:predicted porin